MANASILPGAKGRGGAAYYAGVANVLGNYSQSRQQLNAQQGQIAIQSIGAITQTVMAGFDSYRQYSLEREQIQYNRDRAVIEDKHWQMDYELKVQDREIALANKAFEKEKNALELVKLRRASELELPTMAAKMGFSAVAQNIQSDFGRLRTDNIINTKAVQDARTKVDSLRATLDAQTYQNPGINLGEEYAKLAEIEKYVSDQSMIKLGDSNMSIATLDARMRSPEKGLARIDFLADVSTSLELPRQYTAQGHAVEQALFASDATTAVGILGKTPELGASDNLGPMSEMITELYQNPKMLEAARKSWMQRTNPTILKARSAGMSAEDAFRLDPRYGVTTAGATTSAGASGPAAIAASVFKGGTDQTGGYKTKELQKDAVSVGVSTAALESVKPLFGEVVSDDMFNRMVQEHMTFKEASTTKGRILAGGIYQAVASSPGASLAAGTAGGLSFGLIPGALASGAPIARFMRKSDKAGSDEVLREAYTMNLWSLADDQDFSQVLPTIQQLNRRFEAQTGFYRTFGTGATPGNPPGRGIDPAGTGSSYAQFLRRVYTQPASVVADDAKQEIAALYNRVYGASIVDPESAAMGVLLGQGQNNSSTIATKEEATTAAKPPAVGMPGMR